MNFTFPFNKTELILSSGFALLWQSLDLQSESKIFKDNQKSLSQLVTMLSRDAPTVAGTFQKIAKSFVPINLPYASTNLQAAVLDDVKMKSPRKHFQAIASRISSLTKRPDDSQRRATIPRCAPSSSMSPPGRAYSTMSLPATQSMPALVPALSRHGSIHQQQATPSVNLDYLSFGTDVDQSSLETTMPNKQEEVAWEQVLATMDAGSTNIFDGIYGGVSPDTSLVLTQSHEHQMPVHQDWAQEPWQLSALDLSSAKSAAVPQSVLSFSEESITSGEDLVSSTASSNNGSTTANKRHGLDLGAGVGAMASPAAIETFKGIAMPLGDDFDLDSFETRF